MMYKKDSILILLMALTWALTAQHDIDIHGALQLHVGDTLSSSDRVLALDVDGVVVSYPIDSLSDQVSIPIPYASGWADWGPEWTRGRITKVDDRIYVEGVIRKSSGNVAINDDILTLPVGFRPYYRTIMWASQDGRPIRLNADPDGRVWVVSGDSQDDWLSLDGASFYRNEYVHISQIEIGDTYAGGLVFYKADPPVDLDSDGLLDHGLVAAPSDQSSGVSWGCPDEKIEGRFSRLIGNGYQNSQNIISQCTEPDIAARICADLTLNGYNDWFLPTQEEGRMMYENIGPLNGNIGGFVIDRYWTSHQLDTLNVRSLEMADGISYISPKSFSFRVRAIRAFSLLAHEGLKASLALDVSDDLVIAEVDSVDGHVDLILGSSTGGTVAAVPHDQAKTQVPYPTAVVYQADYEDNAGGYRPLGYYKYEDRIYIDGTALRSTGLPTVGDTVFYLPLSHSPRHRIVLQSKHQDGSIRLNVEPNGAVWVVEGSTPNRWLSFDGCSFWRREVRLPEEYNVGEYYGGGIIFYKADPPTDLNGDGEADMGLIAAPTDQSIAQAWGCPTVSVITYQDIGSGATNTASILASCPDPTTTAAHLCQELEIDGYDDWFLPSMLELIKLDRVIGVNATGPLYNIAGLAKEEEYWSSHNALDSTMAHTVMCGTPATLLQPKTNTYRIRAIRVY